jgi:hypothetical protein
MPLGPPPDPAELTGLPRFMVRGRTVHRVFRADRAQPWWFSSVPSPAEATGYGRFDLPSPLGACYLARSAVAAVLEAFQNFAGLLPDVELRARRRAEIVAPDSAPVAANLAAPRAREFALTAAIWADNDRALTQQWAYALHRAGWRALHHGVQHDPAGRLRAVTLFDEAGEHPPYGDADGWAAEVHTVHDDDDLHLALHRYGVSVMRSDVQLPVVPLEESGLG